MCKFPPNRSFGAITWHTYFVSFCIFIYIREIPKFHNSTESVPKESCVSFVTSWHGMGGILWKSPRYKKPFTKKTGFRDREVLLSTVNFTGTYVGIIQMTFLFLHSRLSVKFTYRVIDGFSLLPAPAELSESLCHSYSITKPITF